MTDGASKREKEAHTRGSAGRFLGVEHLGGKAYYHYRAERGAWVSAALEERGYAAVYAKETGYGAYQGVVRSPTGEPLSNPDWIQPGQEYYIPVLDQQLASRPELGAARATTRDAGGRSIDLPSHATAHDADARIDVVLDPATRGLAPSRPRPPALALQIADKLSGFNFLPKSVQGAILRGEATWPDGTFVQPDDFRFRPLKEESLKGFTAWQQGKSPVEPTDRERLVMNLAETLIDANKLTAFDILPKPVQQAILRGEAAWPDGTPVDPDDMSRLKELERSKRKPLYRDLLKPGEREPSIEEQAQLGGLLRVFLMLLATDPVVADRIVQDTLFFRYPDDQVERAKALEGFWSIIFDPLLWLTLDPAVLLSFASKGAGMAQRWAGLARNARSWSIEANRLLGDASGLARAGRVPEALALARQAQEIAASEASHMTASTGVTKTPSVRVAPTPVPASAAGNAMTIQEARMLADSMRLNPAHNAVDTPAFTLNGEPYWGPYYRSERGIAEALEQGWLGGRGPSVGAAFPENPSAMAYLRNHPVVDAAISSEARDGRTLSFYTKVRPERYYGNSAMWSGRVQTWGPTGRVEMGPIREGMRLGKIEDNDAAFVEIFFVELD